MTLEPTRTIWNVHTISGPHLSLQLEALLNAHARKGYSVHSLWSQARRDGTLVRVTFVREVPTREEAAAYDTRRLGVHARLRAKAKQEEECELDD